MLISIILALPKEALTTIEIWHTWGTPAIQNNLSDLCFLVAERATSVSAVFCNFQVDGISTADAVTNSTEDVSWIALCRVRKRGQCIG